jgi:chromate reductase
LSASIGSTGGALSQQHLRNVLAYLDVSTLAQPEAFIHVKDGFFEADGGIASAGSKKFLQGWMDRYVAWVKRHAG